MPFDRIKNASGLAASGIATTLIVLVLLLVSYPFFLPDLMTFLMLLNVVIMAANVFVFYFLVVMTQNIEKTNPNPKPRKKKTKLKVT